MSKKKEMKFESFTPEQRKELNQVTDSLVTDIQDSVEEAISNAVGDKSELDLAPDKKAVRADRKNYQAFDRIWKSNGRLAGTDARLSIEDLFNKDKEIQLKMKDNFSSDHPLLIPRVISNMAREAIEPNLVVTNMLPRINYSAGTRVVFPAWGAIHAADIPEGGEYPERTMELAGQVEATIGKSGVAIKVSEEMIRYSQFDVISMHVRAAGRALARWKEQKIIDQLTTDRGNVVMDNGSATTKASTGRDPAGAYNGTLCLDDLFYVYAYQVNRGFTPNTIIMHPFAWQIFAQEGIARAFGFVNGMNPLMWQAPNGSAGNVPGWNMGGINRQTYASDPGQLATTFTNVPSIFPTNFRIVVSPYMPFDSTTNKTTIIFGDQAEMGLLVVDEDVVTDEWEDRARDVKKIKFRERYGIAMPNDGRGFAILKNIKVGKSYDFADKIMYTVTGLTNSLTLDTGNLGS